MVKLEVEKFRVVGLFYNPTTRGKHEVHFNLMSPNSGEAYRTATKIFNDMAAHDGDNILIDVGVDAKVID